MPFIKFIKEAIKFELLFWLFRFLIVAVYVAHERMTGDIIPIMHSGNLFWVALSLLGGALAGGLTICRSWRFVGWKWQGRLESYTAQLMSPLLVMAAICLLDELRNGTWMIKAVRQWYLNSLQMSWGMYLPIEVLTSWVWLSQLVVICFGVGYILCRYLFDSNRLPRTAPEKLNDAVQ